MDRLYKTICERKKNLPKDSYVASLFRKGADTIIQKVGEEATEVVIAAKNRRKDRIVSEVADLWFHLLVLLSALDITPKDIETELKQRMK